MTNISTGLTSGVILPFIGAEPPIFPVTNPPQFNIFNNTTAATFSTASPGGNSVTVNSSSLGVSANVDIFLNSATLISPDWNTGDSITITIIIPDTFIRADGYADTFTLIIPSGDFSLAASPATLYLFPSATKTSNIAVTFLGGLTNAVNLTAATVDTDLTVSITPNTGIANYTGVLSVTCNSAPTFGTATVVVTGNDPIDGITHTVNVTINIVNFTIAAATSPLTINAGQTITDGITVTYEGPLTPHAVDLSVSSTSIDLTVGVSPNTGTNTYSSTLTVTCDSTPAVGSFDITIVGNDAIDGVSVSLVIPITITIPDFSIAITPATVPVLTPGQTTDFTVTVAPLNSYTGTVVLSAVQSCSSANAHVFNSADSVVTFTPGSGMPLFTSDLNIALNINTLWDGEVSITVFGTDGTLTHSATLSYKVANFSLGFTPEGGAGSTSSNLHLRPGLVSIGNTVQLVYGIFLPADVIDLIGFTNTSPPLTFIQPLNPTPASPYTATVNIDFTFQVTASTPAGLYLNCKFTFTDITSSPNYSHTLIFDITIGTGSGGTNPSNPSPFFTLSPSHVFNGVGGQIIPTKALSNLLVYVVTAVVELPNAITKTTWVDNTDVINVTYSGGLNNKGTIVTVTGFSSTAPGAFSPQISAVQIVSPDGSPYPGPFFMFVGRANVTLPSGGGLQTIEDILYISQANGYTGIIDLSFVADSGTDLLHLPATDPTHPDQVFAYPLTVENIGTANLPAVITITGDDGVTSQSLTITINGNPYSTANPPTTGSGNPPPYGSSFTGRIGGGHVIRHRGFRR